MLQKRLSVKQRELEFTRFKENILIDGNVEDVQNIPLGDALLKAGQKVKVCLPQCPRFVPEEENKKCPFAKGVIFAKVVQSGMIYCRKEKK